jgi:hypothetical protein
LLTVAVICINAKAGCCRKTIFRSWPDETQIPGFGEEIQKSLSEIKSVTVVDGKLEIAPLLF